MNRRIGAWIGLAGWGVAVAAGFVVLMAYQNDPGPLADAPSDWPAAVDETPAASRYTLAVFAHPHCPCTDATMGELARLMRHVRDRLDVHVYFTQPGEFSDAWTQSGLWRKAAAIPGVTPHRDPGAAIAHQFGAYTSGQVLLYDPKGQLVFNGGITGSRGHEGLNKGRQAIAQWIRQGQSDRASTFVFGCLLHAEAEAPPSARFDASAS